MDVVKIIINGKEIWFDSGVLLLNKENFCKVVGTEIYNIINDIKRKSLTQK